MDRESIKKSTSWFGDVSNIAALGAIAVVIISLFKNQSKLFILVGLGTLVLIVFLKYADVRRFKELTQSCSDIPPLGLARGSVRSILALGFFIGLGLYTYYTIKTNTFKDQIFTSLSSLVSAVAGFYFGAKTAAQPQTTTQAPAPEISDINPDEGFIGDRIPITNLSGSGFQAGATVDLVLGTAKIAAENVNVISSTKMTCIFILKPNVAIPGDWNVVVTNPDGQKDILAERFKILALSSPP
jgi:hypothetical protein